MVAILRKNGTNIAQVLEGTNSLAAKQADKFRDTDGHLTKGPIDIFTTCRRYVQGAGASKKGKHDRVVA